ncbi:MAG: HEAT repeat domain-containing protein, partial [Endomicrobiia bacterium]|nr:HEAT repeat domain-containing protein [Endomicrobiia bacterium]
LALGEIKDKDSAAFLKKYASDENIVVRLAVCESLAKLGDYSGKDFVKALAERGAQKEARARAAKAFSYFQLDAQDENILRELAFDEDPVTALEAVRVLAVKK